MKVSGRWGGTNVPYSRQVLLDYITTATADIYTDKQVRPIAENEQQEAVGIIDLMNFDPVISVPSWELLSKRNISIGAWHSWLSVFDAICIKCAAFASDLCHCSGK